MTARGLDDIAAVVIGTSAGGVEALGLLLPMLGADCCAAVLIVVHVPRERPCLLKDLFTRRCALPIREAVDKEPVEPGVVYFAPPDYHLLVDCAEGADASLALSVDGPVHYSRPSIDVLLESAAECWGSRVMAIILTGASEDGAQGMVAVARAGGITVVQQPDEAVAAALPAAAVRTGMAQHVLPLDGIGRLLAELGSRA